VLRAEAHGGKFGRSDSTTKNAAILFILFSFLLDVSWCGIAIPMGTLSITLIIGRRDLINRNLVPFRAFWYYTPILRTKNPSGGLGTASLIISEEIKDLLRPAR
jgi:hypothetical protein